MFISKMLTIVVTHNGDYNNLETCLNFLNSQYKIKNTEVYVLNSTNTVLEFKNFESLKNIRLFITNGVKNITFFKNSVVEISDKPYLLFMKSSSFLTNFRTVDEVLKDLICFDYFVGTTRIRQVEKKNLMINVIEFLRDILLIRPLIFNDFVMFNTKYFEHIGKFTCDNEYDDLKLSNKIDHTKFHVNRIKIFSVEKFDRVKLWNSIKSLIRCRG